MIPIIVQLVLCFRITFFFTQRGAWMLHKSSLNPFRKKIFHKKNKIENVDMIALLPPWCFVQTRVLSSFVSSSRRSGLPLYRMLALLKLPISPLPKMTLSHPDYSTTADATWAA